MHEIDKAAFGAFVAALRREKGFTQKDLAERLFVSDKAVSKWERGGSLPDISLLAPLAECLGVSVSELLACRRIEREQALSTEQTERLVKAALALSEKEDVRGGADRKKWGVRWIESMIVACAGIFGIWKGNLITASFGDHVLLMMALSAVFGLYFCLLARSRLPRYHDIDRITGMSDGPFRMNLPGISFNNRNWPHIVNVGRWWSVITLALYPFLYAVMIRAFPSFWERSGEYILLAISLGGLFGPMIAAAKKYE